RPWNGGGCPRAPSRGRPPARPARPPSRRARRPSWWKGGQPSRSSGGPDLEHDLEDPRAGSGRQGEGFRSALQGKAVGDQGPDPDLPAKHQTGGEILHVDRGAVGSQDLLLRGGERAQIDL